ncbi:MAG: SxtJ family membrane protein [Vicinamibacterales bacterium]
MQWADVTRRPTDLVLRQFAGLWLLFFTGAAAWRAWHVGPDARMQALAALGLVIGSLGLWRPRAMRYFFTGWMIAAFPIGWTVSQLALSAVFFLVFTPIALMFRVIGRDNLLLLKPKNNSYWITKDSVAKADQYFRQF